MGGSNAGASVSRKLEWELRGRAVARIMFEVMQHLFAQGFMIRPPSGCRPTVVALSGDRVIDQSDTDPTTRHITADSKIVRSSSDMWLTDH